MDFFLKKETKDEHLAKEASGDIDLIESPRDGKLVVVCQQNGVHVCGYCLGMFEDDRQSPLRGVEFVPPGASERGENWGTRILIHAKCITAAGGRGRRNLVDDRVRGHQARRFLTKAFSAVTGKKA